jgi:hypothetical protein
MIALGYVLFAFGTLVSILVATGIAFTVSWLLGRPTSPINALNP